MLAEAPPKWSEEYEMVVGLEVHAQLKTKTKLMSPAANTYGAKANTAVSNVCTGMPGALPVLNQQAIRMAVATALAFNCRIRSPNVFSRKHYFYPDLPKGYQISQFDRPYAENGQVEFYFEGEKKVVGLIRIHLEEDAGKNLHFPETGVSLVDLNRSSVPLIEIVSKPEIRSAEEASAYLKALRRVLRYLDVCDGNLEEGNFRCDANLSLRPKGTEKFGTRVELKNINSFRNLEKALQFEASRQYQLLQNNQAVVQETRLWDANQNQSISMRTKEEASDYRYLPEPDLLPLEMDADFIEQLQQEAPELPINRLERFIKQYERTAYDADVLTSAKELANYYEKVTQKLGDPQLASNFIQTHVLAAIEDIEQELSSFYPDAQALGGLLLKVKDGSLSLSMAKEAFDEMKASQKTAETVIQEKGLSQVSDEGELEKIVGEVIEQNPKQLEQYRSGKNKVFGFFMGQCQKRLKGKGNPQKLKELLETRLNS